MALRAVSRLYFILFSVPLVGFHVDFAVDEGDALFFEEQDLFVDTAEGECRGRLAEAVDHAKAGDCFRVGVDVESVADDAAPFGIARKGGDLSVGRDLAVGDLFDHVVYQLEGVFHGITSLSVYDYSIMKENRSQR